MSLDRFLADAVRAALLLGLGLAVMPLLRRAPASLRRLVLALALGGALILPAVSAVVPAWHIGARPSLAVLGASPSPSRSPRPARARRRRGLPRRPSAGAGAAFPPRRSGLGPRGGVGDRALLVAARLAAGLLRSRAMVRRASPAASWARAAARAARVAGLHADVRTTGELDAPAVTGVLSPVVLVPARPRPGRTPAASPCSSTSSRTCDSGTASPRSWRSSPAPCTGSTRWCGSPPADCASSASSPRTTPCSPRGRAPPPMPRISWRSPAPARPPAGRSAWPSPRSSPCG